MQGLRYFWGLLGLLEHCAPGVLFGCGCAMLCCAVLSTERLGLCYSLGSCAWWALVLSTEQLCFQWEFKHARLFCALLPCELMSCALLDGNGFDGIQFRGARALAGEVRLWVFFWL